jgi:hypothetical protein
MVFWIENQQSFTGQGIRLPLLSFFFFRVCPLCELQEVVVIIIKEGKTIK